MPGPGPYGNKKYGNRRNRILSQIVKSNRGKWNRYIRNHGGAKPPARVVMKWGRKPKKGGTWKGF